MSGFSLRNRSTFRAVLAVVVILVVAVGAGRAMQSPEPTPKPGPSSVLEMCQLPATDLKAGGAAYRWQVTVRLDSPQQSAILFISGPDIAQCVAYRGADGTFASSTLGIGRYEPRSGTALTYDTGSSSTDGATYPNQLVIGQVPAGTASIQLLTTDGQRHDATIGNGWYMAWAITTGTDDTVARIDAFDSTGKVIASLADPSGLQAGTTGPPFSS